jgi:hypothetical protein
MNHTRHTIDIITIKVFKDIVELYENFCLAPIFSHMQSTIMKTFRVLVDSNLFIEHMQHFIE